MKQEILENLPQASIFKFTKEELNELYNKGWTDQKIADFHLSKYGIKISGKTVWAYARCWNLKKGSDIMMRQKITKELLGKGLSLIGFIWKKLDIQTDIK